MWRTWTRRTPKALPRSSKTSSRSILRQLAKRRQRPAGATEAVMSIFAIEEGWVPTSVGSTPLDPKIELHVPTTRTCGCFRRVLSNDFAFGGNNVSVLMGAP